MNKGNAGKGRRKGSRNKTTENAKAAIELAFAGIGGVTSFTKWARDNPTEFYTRIYPRILPKEMEHSGPDGGPVQVTYSHE